MGCDSDERNDDGQFYINLDKMPGLNCCIPGCTNYQKKGGKSIFKIVKATDDWSQDWRSKIVSIVSKYRVLDSDFKRQLDGNNVAICEDHYEDECLLHRKFYTLLSQTQVMLKLNSNYSCLTRFISNA